MSYCGYQGSIIQLTMSLTDICVLSGARKTPQVMQSSITALVQRFQRVA